MRKLFGMSARRSPQAKVSGLDPSTMRPGAPWRLTCTFFIASSDQCTLALAGGVGMLSVVDALFVSRFGSGGALVAALVAYSCVVVEASALAVVVYLLSVLAVLKFAVVAAVVFVMGWSVCVPLGCLCCLCPTASTAPVSSSSPSCTLLVSEHCLFLLAAARVAVSNSGCLTLGSIALLSVFLVSAAAVPGGWYTDPAAAGRKPGFEYGAAPYPYSRRMTNLTV